VRVTREQAAANRERILEVAGTLFRQHGYDGIGVAEIMKQAGLTHGGFYGHFASKDELAAEITGRVLGRPGWTERLTRSANPTFGDVVRGYLSTRHRDDAGRGCLFAALASDVVRQPKPVRHAFTQGLRDRVETLGSLLPGRSAIPSSRTRSSTPRRRRLRSRSIAPMNPEPESQSLVEQVERTIGYQPR